jgi:hypothetical protein
LVLAVATAGGVALMYPGAVRALYLELYPSDPAKAEALELCFAENHAFNRLDPGEREGCYRRLLQAAGEVANAQMAAAAVVNAVDLRHAAGLGGMPRNDVRRQEETDSFIRPAH